MIFSTAALILFNPLLITKNFHNLFDNTYNFGVKGLNFFAKCLMFYDLNDMIVFL